MLKLISEKAWNRKRIDRSCVKSIAARWIYSTALQRLQFLYYNVNFHFLCASLYISRQKGMAS
jgi:hypothetical protein